MARKIKSAAQKAHEARNHALKIEANKVRRARKSENKKAFKANIAAMKKIGAENKAARIDAHEQRNAEAAYEAAQRRADRKSAHTAANDNRKAVAAA